MMFYKSLIPTFTKQKKMQKTKEKTDYFNPSETNFAQ